METQAELSDKNTRDLTSWKSFYFSYYIYINAFLFIVLLLNALGWFKSLAGCVCVFKGRQAGNLEKESIILKLSLFYNEFLKCDI